MSRAANIILLLIAVISVTLGAYLIVFPRVQDIHMDEVKGSLLTTGRLLKEMDVADEVRLSAKLSELARRSSLRDLIRSAPAEARDRQGWLNKLRAEVASLTTAARGVAPVKDFFVLNDKGVGLVRNIDLHWTGKTPTADPKFLEAIDKARSGTRRVLIVQEGTNLLRAVVVPVYVGGRVAAILCATFPLDDGIAKARTGDMGLDVEFTYVSRTGIASGAMSDEVKKSLEKFVKDRGVQVTKLLEGKAMPAQEFPGSAGRLLVAGVPVSAYGAGGQLGIVLARNVDKLGKPYTELSLWLFGIGGLCLVVLVIVVVVFGGRTAGALKQLEVDALEISSGDEKRRFKVEGPAQLKTLAELLNQIVARARGEEPPGEEEEEPAEALAEEPQEAEMEAAEEEEEEEKPAIAEPEEVKPVMEEEAAGSELDVTAPDDEKGIPGKAEREIAAWEEEAQEEEEVGPPLEESVEENTAEVTLDEAARQMEIERMQEQARKALETGAIREVEDEDEDEDDEPPTRVADLGDLQALRDAASAGEELKLPVEEKKEAAEPLEETPEEKPAEAAPETPPAKEKPETEEEKYYREMFEEFVRAKKDVGDKVEKLNLDRFVRKLKKQEEVLKAKHGCKGVRFQVTVKNNQVSLRPRIIR